MKKISGTMTKELFKLIAEDNALGFYDFVKDNKIDINTVDKSGVPLIYESILKTSLRVFKQIIIHPKIDINDGGNNNYTPLMFACSENDIRFILPLIRTKKIDLNIRDDRGYSALYQAVLNDNSVVINELIEAGAEATKLEINAALSTRVKDSLEKSHSKQKKKKKLGKYSDLLGDI